MLDTQTKRRIDDCRDILVGKLPDPKAQIEQITIGLIYKFMDDMDKEAVELGGQAKFFSDYKLPDPEFPNDRAKDKINEFSKYAWDKLLHPKVTATEMLTLYSEAIEGMEKNPNIPQLFRDIFNNAYLPYRDPETLKLFLKTIGEFEYTHSEKLGDAFEYLLSVMGSQGDAGQFRTPRHIIDFLVAIIDPDKTDTILDPACGTAGFLISAYKHILLKYSKDNKQGLNIYEYNKLEKKPFNNLGDQLTPDDRKKLIQNFVGYDISPDMVRLSLVNLYLHGFNTPNIHEYDTLSSEERWNVNFDVVLANPPFMSPKGGIRPHKKFTISSNRSEVLFVDYIAEHLNPNGKAGIIVPEGIIFQSGTAYKDLRKMLVENHLYAVVSLPAGVFNPYSGVKTSILLMDKEVAKKRDEILFIKIDNDGYNLGAQRTAVKGSQLDDAINLIHNYVESGDLNETKIATSISKTEISKNGDYNLTGDRYILATDLSMVNFPLVELNEVVELESGSRDKGGALLEGIPSIGGEQIDSDGNIRNDKMKYVSESHFNGMTKGVLKANDVLVVKDGATTGKTGFYHGQFKKAAVNEHVYIFRSKLNILPIYLYELVRGQHFQNELQKFVKGIIGGISSEIKSIQIPLPPLSIQEEIVAEVEGCQKIIDGATAVVANYKPKIDIDPDWEMVELGKHCKIKGGNAFKSVDYVDEGVQLIRMGNVKQMFFDKDNSPSFLPISYLEEHPNYVLEKGDLLISMTGTVGKEDYGNVCQIDVDDKYLLNQRVGKFEIKTEDLDQQYLFYVAQTDSFRKQLFVNSSGGVRQSNISNKGIESILIPLPPIATQTAIVLQIEKEIEIVNGNKQLIEIFEQKIKDRIAKVWGE